MAYVDGISAQASPSTFVFADLAGFTALTNAHGDVQATEIAADFAARVRGLLREYGGEEVKTIGDEVMIRLESPRRGVMLGLRIVAELAAPGSPPVRVGVHSGPAVERDGDWFGGTVNLASRVSGAARAGEVLLTEGTLRLCGHDDAIDFEPRGSHHFKHIPEPVPIYRAVSAGAIGASLEIDPVCRMAVDPQGAAAVGRRRGFTYYFCSPECERAFAANPRRYVADSPAARAARMGFLINLAAFLIVGAVHAVAWATGWTHHESEPPLFLYVGAAWAIGLAMHYRAVRRVL